ncbi:MAG: hypothetical protein FT726_05065 [Pantoea sp. Morm]|uniref:hypothetical protein n=1 Tax=Pantoea sp. Morm TaxID=2601250 RepID=UPI001D23D24D|nr:hypothetical protein [Pantoea sp. Morm]
MTHTVQDVLDSAKNEHIVITHEQAQRILSGQKVCGLFYCIRWNEREGRIYVEPKPPIISLKPKAQIVKDLEKMEEEKKNKEEKDKTLKSLLSMYDSDFIEKLLSIDADILENLNTFLWTLGESSLGGQEFKEVAEAELKARKEPTNTHTHTKPGI